MGLIWNCEAILSSHCSNKSPPPLPPPPPFIKLDPKQEEEEEASSGSSPSLVSIPTPAFVFLSSYSTPSVPSLFSFFCFLPEKGPVREAVPPESRYLQNLFTIRRPITGS